MNETKCIKNCTKARMTRKAEERTKAMIECGCIICDNGSNIPICDIHFLQVEL